MSDNSSSLKSKKFVAYLLAEITWKLLAFAVLVGSATLIPTHLFWILLVIILVAGFIEIGYILGIASLEKYTHLVNAVVSKGLESRLPLPKGLIAKNEPTKEDKKS